MDNNKNKDGKVKVKAVLSEEVVKMKQITLEKNRVKGPQGEQYFANSVQITSKKGSNPIVNVRTQVAHMTPLGKRVIDAECKHQDGTLRHFEIKTGKAVYSKDQKEKDKWLLENQKIESPVRLVRVHDQKLKKVEDKMSKARG